MILCAWFGLYCATATPWLQCSFTPLPDITAPELAYITKNGQGRSEWAITPQQWKDMPPQYKRHITCSVLNEKEEVR